jgi:DNA-binding CsgD family transcriptional regulator
MLLAYRSLPAVWKGWQLVTSPAPEVSDLVSTGMTSKQVVGASLYGSPYTVESHPCAIYRKLGMSRRAALASHVNRVNETAQAGT